jgi:hypothetical protein
LKTDTVIIDKGYFVPKRTWRFTRADAALRVTPESHPWQGPALCVHDRVSETPIGDFLNREESLELLAVLRKELPVKTHSNSGAIDA